VVTAGGTALVDGQDDVPPTLDLRVSASRSLAPDSVQVALDGARLALGQSPGGAVTASVPPMPLSSAHVLELDVPGRAAQRISFHVAPPAGAMAALHTDPRDGAVLDVVLQFAADHGAVEANLPHGAAASWLDDRHLRATWPSAPGGVYTLRAGLPVARGSHLAAALSLSLDPVPGGALRSTVVPVPDAPVAPPLVVAFTTSTARSRASLAAHWSQISLVSPTGLHVDATGAVHGAADEPAVATADQRGLPVWPLIQNDASDSQAISALLESHDAVNRLVTAARRIAAQARFPGVHLDIEGVPENDRDHLTALVTALASGLHADNRKLAVAVVPHKPGHLNVYSAAYDLGAISGVADLVTLMAYDEHTSLTGPGAVAGLAWQGHVLDGSLPEMHSSGTALLGMPLYARTWDSSGASADSYAASLASALLSPGAHVDYDFDAATPLVRSGDGATTTYFDDAASLRAKLALASSLHLRGIALWRLGFEDPAFWDALPTDPPRP
jgi:spore germination protein